MPATDAPIRVLIVDDHPMVREGLRSMLGAEDMDVVGEAASGAEALRRAGERDIDVMLLDMELPDMDGLAVLRRIREMDARLPSSWSRCTRSQPWSAARSTPAPPDTS